MTIDKIPKAILPKGGPTGGPGKKVIKRQDILRRFIDALPLGVTVIDPDQVIIYMNTFLQERFGELRGKKCYELYHALGVPHPDRPMDLEKGDDVIECPGSDGRYYRIRHSENRLRGGRKALVAVVEDITDHRRMSKELDALRDMLGVSTPAERYVTSGDRNALRPLTMYYHEIDVNPVTETIKPSTDIPETSVTLNHKTVYYVEERKPVRSFREFARHVAKGAEGLCITRIHPSKIRESWNLKTTPIIWLSNIKDPKVKSLEPTALVNLLSLVSSFLKKAENGVVLLDGIEYLISLNTFQDVLKYIGFINDKVMMSESTLIVGLDPGALEKKEVRLLERDMIELKDTVTPK